ncbi:MAG: hypothetical protein HY000_40300 [Planctomycetes bacterium]|nr:hypothetical protein [Planctomycetota bacterium]
MSQATNIKSGLWGEQAGEKMAPPPPIPTLMKASPCSAAAPVSITLVSRIAAVQRRRDAIDVLP